MDVSGDGPGDGRTRDPVEAIAEEFVERLRRGEKPAIEEYTARFPERAAEIRELFATLLVVEEADPTRNPPRPAAPLQAMGDFRILREIGRGGMGIVYEAVQESLSRRVALKVLSQSAVGDERSRTRFRRESKAAACLHHTNIVPVFDFGEENGILYYAMQYISGQSLDLVLRELRRLRAEAGSTAPEKPASDELRSSYESSSIALKLAGDSALDPSPEGPARPREDAGAGSRPPAASTRGPIFGRDYFINIARLGRQAADALACAHAEGILHRDLKPANLLLDARGQIWISDFGLAKGESSEDLTQAGDVVGTMVYMAPERFSGRSDPRSDIYSLGLTLYELFTLKPAFRARDRASLLRQVCQVAPQAPSRIDPSIPRDLETIVLKAIEKEPARRYAAAADLRDDLDRFLDDRPILARRVRFAERIWLWCLRNPLPAAMSAALAAVILASGIALAVSHAHLLLERDKLKLQGLTLEEARSEARRKLFESRISEARASRWSGRAGQRFRSLEALAEAASLSGEVAASPAERQAILNEAIASLARVDLDGVHRARAPPGEEALGFDSSLRRYLTKTEAGELIVRDRADGSAVIAIPHPEPGSPSLWFDVRAATVCRAAARYRTRGRPGGLCVLWDLESGKQLLSRPGNFETIQSAVIDEERRLFAVCVDGEAGSTLETYDLETAAPRHRIPGLPGSAVRISLHPGGCFFALAGADGILEIHAFPGGGLVRRIDSPERVMAMAWHPQGRWLATNHWGSRDIRIWDTRDVFARSPLAATLEGHENQITFLAFHPAGELLVSSGWDGTTRLWDAQRLRPLLATAGQAAGFNLDGTELWHHLNLGELGVWRLGAPEVCRSTRHPDAGPQNAGFIHCALWPAGPLAAVASPRAVHFFDARTLREIERLSSRGCTRSSSTPAETSS